MRASHIAVIVLFAGTGLFLLYFAYAIGIKGKLTLLHDYHTQHLQEKEKRSYQHLIALGLCILSIALFVCAVRFFFTHTLSLLSLFGGIVIGVSFMVIAQYRYNGSIFGE